MPVSKSKRSRYTPPAPKNKPASPLWVPSAMFTSLGLGVLVIAANYLELLPGRETTNTFLAIGLLLLISGFVLSTYYR